MTIISVPQAHTCSVLCTGLKGLSNGAGSNMVLPCLLVAVSDCRS